MYNYKLMEGLGKTGVLWFQRSRRFNMTGGKVGRE